MSAPIDPAFDTPFNDYGQVGSFVAPVAVPSLGPLDGTLVNLPCINPDWLRLVLGCVDQLRNRSSWLQSYTDAQIVAILGAVEELRIALQMANPCCDVAMRLEANCVLQFSTDGGATWTDVAGWADNFANCVKQAVIPPPPLLPPGSTPATRACNIASYIANQVIHEAITQAINAYNHDLSLLQLAGNVAAATFAFELPWTTSFIFGVYDLYQFFTAGNIADLTAAEADATLWSLVTCAIYNEILTDGAITTANCSAVIAAICGLRYSRPIAITTICAYITQLGCDQLRALQVVGALATGDCSGCASWCYYFNFAATDGSWTAIDIATYVSGCCWHAVGVGGGSGCDIDRTFPATTLTGLNIHWACDFVNGSAIREIRYLRGGVVQRADSLFGAAEPDGVEQDFTFSATIIDEIQIYLRADSAGATENIAWVKLFGPGTNPFGTNNCP